MRRVALNLEAIRASAMYDNWLSAEYASAGSIRDDMQRTYTTQSLPTTSDSSIFNVASLPSRVPQPADLSSERFLPYPASTVSTEPQTYRSSNTSSLHSSYQNMRRTPQPTGDRGSFEYFSDSSSANANLGLHAVGILTPSSLGASPGYWPPAVSQHHLYQEIAWRNLDFNHLNHIHMETLMFSDEALNQHTEASSVAMKVCSPNTIEPKSMSVDALSTMPELTGSVDPKHTLSPVSDELYDSCTDDGENPPSPWPNEQEDFTSLEMSEAKRADGPYAQLIYQALMSREDYTMTLQEIYQWFRENTVRADPKHKGWQNTVRHNLSMNDKAMLTERKAFVKRETRDTTHTDPVTHVETPKRSTKWILADWAVRDGVQSTSRYRQKKGSSQNHKNLRRFNRGH